MKNPALREEPRYEPAPVIPLKQEGSLLDWLQENDRLIFREEKGIELPAEEEEEEEIADLIEGEDLDYDDFSDSGDELEDLDD